MAVRARVRAVLRAAFAAAALLFAAGCGARTDLSDRVVSSLTTSDAGTAGPAQEGGADGATQRSCATAPSGSGVDMCLEYCSLVGCSCDVDVMGCNAACLREQAEGKLKATCIACALGAAPSLPRDELCGPAEQGVDAGDPLVITFPVAECGDVCRP
jgi:hypothetical protein